MLNVAGRIVHQFPKPPYGPKPVSAKSPRQHGLVRSRRLTRAIIGRRVSTPRTKYTEDTINTVPLYGLKLVKEVIGKAFPELAEFGFTDTRVRPFFFTSLPNRPHHRPSPKVAIP